MRIHFNLIICDEMHTMIIYITQLENSGQQSSVFFFHCHPYWYWFGNRFRASLYLHARGLCALLTSQIIRQTTEKKRKKNPLKLWSWTWSWRQAEVICIGAFYSQLNVVPSIKFCYLIEYIFSFWIECSVSHMLHSTKKSPMFITMNIDNCIYKRIPFICTFFWSKLNCYMHSFSICE